MKPLAEANLHAGLALALSDTHPILAFGAAVIAACAYTQAVIVLAQKLWRS